ncbi:SapC family protein [Hyphococcus sp.]|uniref:SapC family protein n=1 Tax=Hyphococcus sp. TaxID=2038636 RepID=UPI003CCBECE5
MSEAQASPEITGKMYLYEKPELLMKEQHGDLAMKPAKQPFAFVSKARAVPITLSEIPAAMKDYPLVFMSVEQPQLLAITGLFDDINLFVNEEGGWEDSRYIPGYVRRYPFGLAAETNGERMAIVIDRAFEGIAPDGEVALFKDGEPTEETKAAIEYCKSYERDRQMTDQFAQALKALDLIQPQTAQYTPQGASEPVNFAQYCSVDEKKLGELSDDKVLELYKNGTLPLVYALLMSMSNWRHLLQRRARRFNLSEEDIFKPQTVN